MKICNSNKLFAITLLSTVSLPAVAQERPNVLLLLADDMGWGDIAAHGNDIIRTPVLDRMHDEAVVLDRFYVSPLSALTRAALLTGRYHLSTRVTSVQNGLENMNPEETTIAELFKKAGYKTGCFGKWHNGAYYPYTPNGQGFEEFYGFCCGHWTNYFDPILQHNEEMTVGKGYISDIFTDAAIDFIKENKEKPFFCYVPYNAPHSPLQVPDEYYHHYDGLKAGNERDRNAMAAIYGMVENVDHNIGRILEVLDEDGLREKTIVIFMTDNGPTCVTRYNGGMRGCKGQVHEGGVRVPCYIEWKEHTIHKQLNYPAAHIDILPTLMDMCGIRKYRTAFPIAGISLKDIIMGNKTALADREIGFHVMRSSVMPSTWDVEEHLSPRNRGGWLKDSLRLVLYENELMMFNLNQDPSETHNIYNPKSKVHRKMVSNYMKWYNKVTQNIHNGDLLVPVGYDEAKEVRIPAPEGHLSGHLKCYGFPNQNWVNHFKSQEDEIKFNISVVDEADYEVIVEYIYDGHEPNAKVVFLTGTQKVETIIPHFKSKQLPAPDRIKRGEAYPMKWRRQSLGRVHLVKGKHLIRCHAKNILSLNDVKIKTLILLKQN